MSGMKVNNGNITGRLTRDPELKYFQDGTAYCTFGIAQDDYAPAGQEPAPMFFNVTAFGKHAENIQKFFKQGKEIAILYKLKYRSWVDQATGMKRSTVDLHVKEWEFVSGGKRDDEEGEDQDNFADRETPPARHAPQPARTAPTTQRPPTTQNRTPAPTAPVRRPPPTTAPQGQDDGGGDPFVDE